jgi:hypothetical protein
MTPRRCVRWQAGDRKRGIGEERPAGGARLLVGELERAPSVRSGLNLTIAMSPLRSSGHALLRE